MGLKIRDLAWENRSCCGRFRHARIGGYEIQETDKGYVVLKYNAESVLDPNFGEAGVMRRLSADQVETILADG